MSLTFDKTRCLRCGICLADCVCGILTFGKDGFPTLIEGMEQRCVQCGHCVAVCPTGAAILNGKDPLSYSSVKEVSNTEESLEFFLKGRRAIRQYECGAVSHRLLEKAFEYATYAPTAHNSHEVAYTVINGRERVEHLLSSLVQHMEMQGLYPAHTKNVHQGKDTLFRGAPCIILIHAPERILSESDCATAAAYLELAFYGMGLGSCWAGMMVEACTQSLPKGLSLPKGHKLYAALMVGTPKVRYSRIPLRPSPSVIWEEDL